jgi:amino acid adenylation domain-containing protein
MQVNFIEYLEEFLAKQDKSRIAIVDGPRQVTFRELEVQAKCFASVLSQRLCETNRPVAVFLPKCPETVFADIGIVYSGNIYSNLDIKSPPQRIKNILDNLEPTMVITIREFGAILLSLGVPEERLLFAEEVFAAAPEYDEVALLDRRDRIIDTDPLCIIYTSGSTGTPKGVVLSHRGTIDFVDWALGALGLDGDERMASLSPFYFDIFTLELATCIARGSTLVIVPEQMAMFPAKLMTFLQEQRISFLFWVPSIMVNISNQGLLEKVPLPSLEKVLFAGEVFPMKHLNLWRKALPRATFVNLYGPIEIHVDCTFFILDREFGDEDSLPIGFPCRNTDVLILNDQNRPCGTDEHGELCIRGSSLAMGYWNDPVKTARAFVQNPLNRHYPEPVYRTGDIVYRNAANEIMFVGRKDFQIKHMGYRIELLEIEHHVLAITGIANACVVYEAHRKEITLFYEAALDTLTPAEIRKTLAGVLPKYMLPTAFHRTTELPRNPNGKIDRNGLTQSLSNAADAARP